MNFKKSFTAAVLVISTLLFSSCGNTSGDVAAWNGNDLYTQGSYEEALNSYLDAEKSGIKSFNEAKLYSSIGNCYYQLGNYEKSIEYQIKCLDCDPEYFEGWVNLGISYRKTDNNEKAMTCYEVALNYDPQNKSSVPLYTSLGSFYVELNKPISAIKYLEMARNYYPEKADIHAYLAIAYKMAFEYEKSGDAFEKAQALGYTKLDEIQKQLDKLN